MAMGTLKREETNRRSVQLSCKHFAILRSLTGSMNLVFPPCAVLMSRLLGCKLKAGELCHSAPFTACNGAIGEILSCFVLVDGVDTAGLSLVTTCLHISSGEGSRFPWFIPLSPSLRALKARKVCRFEVIHVNISNRLSALESAISLA